MKSFNPLKRGMGIRGSGATPAQAGSRGFNPLKRGMGIRGRGPGRGKEEENEFQSPQTGHGYTGIPHSVAPWRQEKVSIPSNGAWVYGDRLNMVLPAAPTEVSIPSNGAWVYGVHRSHPVIQRRPKVSIPSNGAWVYGDRAAARNSADRKKFQSPQTGHGYTGATQPKTKNNIPQSFNPLKRGMGIRGGEDGLIRLETEFQSPQTGHGYTGNGVFAGSIPGRDDVSIPSNGAWVYGADYEHNQKTTRIRFNPLKRGMGIRGRRQAAHRSRTPEVSIPSNGAWVYGEPA